MDKILEELKGYMVSKNDFGYKIIFEKYNRVELILKAYSKIAEIAKDANYSCKFEVDKESAIFNEQFILHIEFEYNETDIEFVKGDYVCYGVPALNTDVYKVALKPKVKGGMRYLTLEDKNGNRRELLDLWLRKATDKEVEKMQRLD